MRVLQARASRQHPQAAPRPRWTAWPGGDARAQRRALASGLTLIELLVTISIAAILTAMAAPSFSDFLIRNRSASMANELTSTVLRARNEAINRNACVVMCRSTTTANATPACDAGSANWQPGWIAFVDETCAGTANSAARAELLIVAAGPFDNRYSLTKGGTNTTRIVFSPQGNARVGDAGRFDLQYQSSTRTSNRGICLNAQGRTRVVALGGTC